MANDSTPVLFHLDQGRFGRRDEQAAASSPALPGSSDRHHVSADVANLAGDYTYLASGYYASLDAELAGHKVLPTTAEALDAYVVPLALTKAARAGLSVPEHELVTDRFPPPPILAYPVNPFSSKGELLLDQAAVDARRKGLTYTGKCAVLVQHLTHDHRIDVLRLVLGQSLIPEYQELAWRLFEIFRLPLMKVRIVVTTREYQLSAIEPLPFAELSEDERSKLEGLGRWRG